MIHHEPASASSKSKPKSTARRGKDETAQAVNDIAHQAGSAVHQQKDRAAERIGAVGQALRQAAADLNDDDRAGGIGCYAEQAADQVEHLSQYLREHELSDVVDGVQRWARRNPALFLGGCLVAGLLVARFVKSSTEGASGRARARRSSAGPRNPYASLESEDDDFAGAPTGGRSSMSGQYGGRYESESPGRPGGFAGETRQGLTEPRSGPSSPPDAGFSSGGWEEP